MGDGSELKNADVSICLVEGSLEVKLPTIWTDGKAGGKSQRGEEQK